MSIEVTADADEKPNRFARAPRIVQFALLTSVILFFLCAIEFLSFLVIRAYDRSHGSSSQWHDMVTRFHPLFIHEKPSEYVFDPYLGYRNRARSKVYNYLVTDSNSFIKNRADAPDVARSKPPNTVRIFILGGSSVAGAGLASNSETIAARLENYLNERSKNGVHYEIVNGGTSSYTSAQELVETTIYLLSFAPDIVISLDSWNDFLLTSNEGRRREHPNWIPYHYDLASAFTQAQSLGGVFTMLGARLRETFYVAALLDLMSGRRARPGPAADASLHWHQEFAVSESGFDDYAANLRSLAGALHQNHVKAMLVLQPHLMTRKAATPDELKSLDQIAAKGSYIVASREWSRMGQQLFGKLTQEKRSDDAVFLDFTQTFDRESGPMYLDFIHYNAVGSKLIAHRLGDELLARLRQDGSWDWTKMSDAVNTSTGTPSSIVEHLVGEDAVLEGFDAGGENGRSRNFRLYWRASAASLFRRPGSRWTELRKMTNLLANGNFAGPLENGVPSGWSGSVYGEKNSGDYVVNLPDAGRVVRLRTTGTKPRVGLSSAGIAVSPGQRYLMTGRVFSRGGNGNAAVVWWGPTVTDSVRMYWTLTGYAAPAWHSVLQVVEPVPGATSCQVWLTNTESRGDVYFSDVGMYEVDPPRRTVPDVEVMK